MSSIAATVAAIATGCAASTATETGPELPAVGSPSPATCPSTWTGDYQTASRYGPLVPRGAIEALLCSYPFTETPAMPLGGEHRLASDADAIVNYLNALTSKEPTGEICLLSAVTQHIVVLGYENRPPAIVYIRNCSLDQSGAVRYGGDIQKITGFWGVPWTQSR